MPLGMILDTFLQMLRNSQNAISVKEKLGLGGAVLLFLHYVCWFCECVFSCCLLDCCRFGLPKKVSFGVNVRRFFKFCLQE